MISYLKGQLIEKRPPTLILENSSIGYAIEASMQTFYQLPGVGIEVLLYIDLFIKDEKPILYGFIHTDERQLFQELLKVNTIGPKAALAILSSMDIFSLYKAVKHQDIHLLQSIPGIGRKTAERLLLELTNRLNYWKPTAATENTDKTCDSPNQPFTYSAQEDAIHALIALGYKSQIAAQAVRTQYQKDPSLSTEQLIRAALSQLMIS